MSNAFLDLPTVIAGLHDLLFGTNLASNQTNIDYYKDSVRNYDIKADAFRNSAYNNYQTAQAEYDQNFTDYKNATRSSDKATIESLINESYDTTKSIAEAVKSANNLIQFYKDTLKDHNFSTASLADTHLTTLNTYTGKTNTHLSVLLSAEQAIQKDKDAIATADQSISQMNQDYPFEIAAQEQAIKEKEGSLAKLIAGPDPIDIQSQDLSIAQRVNALSDAKSNLDNYYVRAPFDGVITKVTNKKGDSLSASAVAATILTKQKIATITLNEVDVAKAKVGQKVTLIFDAIDGLSITGEVAEIDSIGTVTQGVVTYNVKIAFDTNDDRVKSGMSVSAAIITDAKQNVLLVPNAAVKQQGGTSYAEIASSTPLRASGEGGVLNSTGSSSSGVVLASTPRNQTVEVGLSNDTMTEIISGLNEGDNVVTRIVAAAATNTASSSSSSGLRIPGLSGGGR